MFRRVLNSLPGVVITLCIISIALLASKEFVAGTVIGSISGGLAVLAVATDLRDRRNAVRPFNANRRERGLQRQVEENRDMQFINPPILMEAWGDNAPDQVEQSLQSEPSLHAATAEIPPDSPPPYSSFHRSEISVSAIAEIPPDSPPPYSSVHRSEISVSAIPLVAASNLANDAPR